MRLEPAWVSAAALAMVAGCGSPSSPALTMRGSTMCPPGSGAVETWCDDAQNCEFRVTTGGVFACHSLSSMECQTAAIQAAEACTRGGGSDSGMPSDGGGPATCGTITGLGEVVPPACLPRCFASTRSAYNACGTDLNCQREAMAADLSPSVMIDNGAGETAPLGCIGCYGLQFSSCQRAACPSEFAEYQECLRTSCPDGTALSGALTSCMLASPGFQGCVDDRVGDCFP